MSGCGDTLCAADSPDSEQMNLSLFPKERSLSPLPPSLSLPSFGPSLPPSLHLSVSGGEKMEHGNYGNCIRQVLGRSLPPSSRIWLQSVRFISVQCYGGCLIFSLLKSDDATHKKALWLCFPL